MKGFLYKELLQNKNSLLFSVSIPLIFYLFILLIMPVFIAMSESVPYTTALQEIHDDKYLHPYAPVIAFIVTGVQQSLIFKNDESKKLGFFLAAQPDGIRRTIYAKYVTAFLLSFLTMTAALFTDMLRMMLEHIIFGTAQKDLISCSAFAYILVFVQLFLRAFDFPFTVRFGGKKGEAVRVISLLVLIMAIVIYLLFGKIPESFGDIFLSAADFFARLARGEAKDTAVLLLGIFMWIAAGAYLLSYRLSCKLYLKGVEQFEK